MKFDKTKDIVPPPGDKVPRRVKKALALEVMGAAPYQIAKVCDVTVETVDNWLAKYRTDKLTRTQIMGALSGAMLNLSAKMAKELERRIDAGEKFSNSELGIVMGISAQRAKEQHQVDEIDQEPDWGEIKI
jgi:transposase